MRRCSAGLQPGISHLYPRPNTAPVIPNPVPPGAGCTCSPLRKTTAGTVVRNLLFPAALAQAHWRMAHPSPCGSIVFDGGSRRGAASLCFPRVRGLTLPLCGIPLFHGINCDSIPFEDHSMRITNGANTRTLETKGCGTLCLIRWFWRRQWYPLAHGGVNPKHYEGDRATRPALQEERGNLCATRPVGWGYRRPFSLS